MAGELIWSRTALEDIEGIASSIGRDSFVHARRFVEKVLEEADRVLEQPTIHHPVAQPDRGGPSLRGLYGHRLLFERQGEDLHLLGVIHG